jgi:hypothetical protein
MMMEGSDERPLLLPWRILWDPVAVAGDSRWGIDNERGRGISDWKQGEAGKNLFSVCLSFTDRGRSGGLIERVNGEGGGGEEEEVDCGKQ